MPFSSYKSISSVAKKFKIKYALNNYIIEKKLSIKEAFKEELDLILEDYL